MDVIPDLLSKEHVFKTFDSIIKFFKFTPNRQTETGVTLLSCMHAHLFEPRRPSVACSEGKGSSLDLVSTAAF